MTAPTRSGPTADDATVEPQPSVRRLAHAAPRFYPETVTTTHPRKEPERIVTAQLVQPKRTNHVLHAILTVFTGGAWGIVWLVQVLRHRNI